MYDMKKIDDMFKTLKIGGIPYAYGIDRISAVPVKNGCNGCYFNKDGEGAKRCDMKASCMAHLRPDHTPVIFIAK